MVPWLVPLALAVVVMLPRLASPQLGLLDDGMTLHTARELSGRWGSVLTLIPETGRFFPASWLVHCVVFIVAGARPLALFTFNVLLLAGLLAMLWRLVRWSGGNAVAAAIAAVVFATCGPAIETFYTLSKPEPLQLTWIAISLLVTGASVRDSQPRKRAGLVALAAAALTLAYASKETSVVLIPISLGWLVIAWASSSVRERRFALTFAAIDAVAAAAFFTLRWWYVPRSLAEGTYTRAYALDPATIGVSLFKMSAWIVRDLAFLLPVLVVAAVALVRGRTASRRAVLYAALWMAGWLAVYAPWPATFAYYLLPFAFGAAALAGIVVANLWTLRGRGDGITTRCLAWTALAVAAVLWLAGVVNAAVDGRVQLTVDRANTDLVDWLATLPEGSRIVANTAQLNEYVFELPRHLTELKRRPDLVVQQIGRDPRGGVPSHIFVVTALMANAPRPTVRIGLDEDGVRSDNARLAGMPGELVYRNERRVRLVEVGLHRSLVHSSTFSYGWQVHRLSPSGAPA